MAGDHTANHSPVGSNRGPRAHAVLLVDSAQAHRALYAEYLRVFGFRAIEIGDTADALALAITVDAIVLGTQISGPFDGVEFVRRIRVDERTAHKPVIGLGADEGDARRSLVATCDVHLAKPCLPGTLVAELRRVLTSRNLSGPGAPCPARNPSREN